MEKTPEEQAYFDKVKRRRKLLAAHITPEVLKTIQDHFQTNLPCFQGTIGQYDPLDAMRRDAQREVILWLQDEISKNKEE